MFDRLIRYLPVLDFIRKYKPARILEVGSNSKGLGEWWDGKFTGVDMDFPEKTVQNMKAVVGSADKLPFHDKSFDLVFSLDTFEHLEKKARGKALEEMLRVCKRTVIIGYPCGKGAEELSRKMLGWFEKRNSGTAKWMEEHVSLGLPSEELVDKSHLSHLSYKSYGNENLFVCEWLLKLEEHPRILKAERYLLLHCKSEIEVILRRLNFAKCYRKIWVIEKN